MGEALTTKTGFGLTLACIGPSPTDCKERALVALDLTRFTPATDLPVGIAAITNTAELLTGAEELSWRDDLDGDGSIDPVLTGGTYALIGPGTPPGWQGVGPAVRAGGVARRGDHLLLATGDAVLEMADLVADLNAATDTWVGAGSSRLLAVDDWDGDGCADVLVSGVGAVGLIPGDCPVVDTDVPVDTVDTPVADTDTVADDTLPADDTGVAPCDPEFGWSCATTDARSALWALGLVIALAGRRRRG
jgi:MYXO-CTERM domain-containing protein